MKIQNNSPKQPDFSHLEHSFGPARVLSSGAPLPSGGFDSFLGIYSKSRLKKIVLFRIMEKIPPKLLWSTKRTPFFFWGGIALPVGRRAQKTGSKFQSNPREPNEERPKSVCYSFQLRGTRGEVRFFTRSNPVFLLCNIS